MAAVAQRDQEKRIVTVDRVKLISILKENRQKHSDEYEEAMAGYKNVLLSKIDESFAEAKKSLEDRYEKTKAKVSNFTDEDISKQNDYFTLIDEISVEMKVPRSFVKEYDAAIDMAVWDVRDTLDLTYAEFTCYVRDMWDWKGSFEAISAIYKFK